jgi:hypothetical protein
MKDLLRRQQQAARKALLRNPPRVLGKNRSEAIAVLSELALIHNSSRLDGATKHELFERGAAQLAKLCQPADHFYEPLDHEAQDKTLRVLADMSRK